MILPWWTSFQRRELVVGRAVDLITGRAASLRQSVTASSIESDRRDDDRRGLRSTTRRVRVPLARRRRPTSRARCAGTRARRRRPRRGRHRHSSSRRSPQQKRRATAAGRVFESCVTVGTDGPVGHVDAPSGTSTVTASEKGDARRRSSRSSGGAALRALRANRAAMSTGRLALAALRLTSALSCAIILMRLRFTRRTTFALCSRPRPESASRVGIRALERDALAGARAPSAPRVAGGDVCHLSSAACRPAPRRSSSLTSSARACAACRRRRERTRRAGARPWPRHGVDESEPGSRCPRGRRRQRLAAATTRVGADAARARAATARPPSAAS